jgi:hypothetical protein
MMKGQWPVKAGDTASILSGGGGGYGHPHERDPNQVAQDVRLGYVTLEAATVDYGVVVKADGTVDCARTSLLRGATSVDTSVLFGLGQDLYFVMTRPHHGQERAYNHWYSSTHVHDLLAIPGIAGAQRFQREAATGHACEGPPYLAIYVFTDTQLAIDGIVARRGTSLMPSTTALDRSASVAVVYNPVGDLKRKREAMGGGAMLVLGMNSFDGGASLDDALHSRWLAELLTLPGIHAANCYKASDFQTKTEPPRYQRIVFAHVDDELSLRQALEDGALGPLMQDVGAVGGEASVVMCNALTGTVLPVVLNKNESGC